MLDAELEEPVLHIPDPASVEAGEGHDLQPLSESS